MRLFLDDKDSLFERIEEMSNADYKSKSLWYLVDSKLIARPIVADIPFSYTEPIFAVFVRTVTSNKILTYYGGETFLFKRHYADTRNNLDINLYDACGIMTIRALHHNLEVDNPSMKHFMKVGVVSPIGIVYYAHHVYICSSAVVPDELFNLVSEGYAHVNSMGTYIESIKDFVPKEGSVDSLIWDSVPIVS